MNQGQVQNRVADQGAEFRRAPERVNPRLRRPYP